MTDDTFDGAETNSIVTRRRFLGATALAAGGLALGTSVTGFGAASQGTSFTVRIENVSTGSTLTTTDEDAAEQPVPLSPGAYAVHRRGEPVFSADEMERNNGLEEIAEDGSPMRLAEALAMTDHVSDSGAFTTPVGADDPAPIGPGGAYEFSVEAGPDDYLSFATMFIPSNDLFFAPDPTGIRLYEQGDPVSGDVTEYVALWDAGTEINEEPGVGENQAQRQRGPGIGLVERGTVANVEAVNGYEYPAVADVVRVTLSTE
jgi:hypothetical protein